MYKPSDEDTACSGLLLKDPTAPQKDPAMSNINAHLQLEADEECADISSPIELLPPELLSEILLTFYEDLKPGWRNQGSKRDLIPFTSVCKRWREVALATTALWTEIDMARPRLIPMLLQRSGQALLLVRCIPDAGYSILNLVGEASLQSWELVLSYSSRISSLHIFDIRSQFMGTWAILDMIKSTHLSWPQLNELKLCVDADISNLSFVSSDPAPLTRLTLNRSPLSFRSPVFGARLLHLHIQRTIINLAGLCTALEQCTRLEALILNNLAFTTVQQRSRNKVSLDCLHWLAVIDMPNENTYILLEHLEIPDTALSQLRIYAHFMPDRLEQLIPSNHNILGRIRQKAQQFLEISDDCASINNERVLGFEKIRMYDFLKEMDAIQLMRFDISSRYFTLFSRSFYSPRCRQLTVVFKKGRSQRVSAVHWQSLIAGYPMLEVLRTRDLERDCGNFHMLIQPLRALMMPNEGNSIASHLQTFVMEFCGPLENVRDKWDKVEKILKRICTQGKKLGELRLVALNSLQGSFSDKDREIVEVKLGNYVGKLTLCSTSES